ncbi:MAG TPA: LuxR C-terminal-related transcriptional regulator [Terrimicrobiaceae bacterium]
MGRTTIGRLTRYLVEMNAALDSREFIESAMKVTQAVAPGFMVSSKCRFLGARGFRRKGSGVVDVESETIERCYRENPGLPLLSAHPGARIVQSSWDPPERASLINASITRCRLPCRLCRQAISLCFWEKTPSEVLDCILSVHRCKEEGPFTPMELEVLNSLHPQIDRARRRVRHIEGERSAFHSLECLVRKLPLATLVLDWELRPVFANAAGRACCAQWICNDDPGWQKQNRAATAIPHELRDICAQMKSEWNDETQIGQPTERTLLREPPHSTGAGRLVRIAMIPLGGEHPGRPSFLLQFLSSPATNASSQMSGDGLAMLAQLTPEQRAVASHICDGKSNDEISTALGKSVCTVKRHIYSIFRKLRISNRTQLAMRLHA